MRASKSERMQAERFSASVDQLIADPSARLEGLEPADLGLVEATRQFARLPSLLGSVDPAFEQRIMQQVRQASSQRRRLPVARIGWALAGLAAVLLVAMLVSPLGQTAVASFMAVFSLGQTEVRITPVDAPSLPLATGVGQQGSIQQVMTLAEARSEFPFALPQPDPMPPGYHLASVIGHSYPNLPAWVPQPFFAELVYEGERGQEFALQVYPIMLGDGASISGLNLQAAPIEDVQDIDVNGQPAVLLRLGGKDADSGLREVVWEQDDLVLALSSVDVTEDELLRVARSVH
jgi:hypothetical protein